MCVRVLIVHDDLKSVEIQAHRIAALKAASKMAKDELDVQRNLERLVCKRKDPRNCPACLMRTLACDL